MKLICAGLPKTGTKSLTRALRILGYKVSGFGEQILYYMDEWLALYKHGKVPDFYAMFKDVDAVIGTPGCFFFEELMEAFPDARVVLSVRNEDAWIKSLKNHKDVVDNSYLYTKMKYLLPTHKKRLAIFRYSKMSMVGTDDLNSSYISRKRYRWHNDRVKSVVPADKLLVYNVQQGWEPLCEFTGNKIPDQPFPHLNVRGTVFRSTFQSEIELGKKVVREVRVVMVCSVVVVALIGVMLMYLF